MSLRIWRSFIAGAAIFSHEITQDTSYRVSYQGVDTNRAFWDGPAGAGSFEPEFSQVSRFDGRTDQVQARLDSRIGSLNLINAGYEFEREDYFNFESNETPAPAQARIGLKQHSHAIFGQDQVRLLDGSLQIARSGRAQFFELADPNITGVDNPYTGAQV